MEAAIRQATVVNRLVSDTRPQTRRRGTRAIPSSTLAGAVDRHRHLRVLAFNSRRRVPRRLTGQRLGPSAQAPGTYQTRCPASFRSVNGLDAIAALSARAGGRVVWDRDWLRFDASGGRVRKLSVTDTGTGMTPEQLRKYINQLASSGREQSAAANFGVGAKIAAGSRNPHGLEYRSWHGGTGRWFASSATLTAAGGSSRSAGRTGVASSGARSASRRSRGCCAAMTTAPRSSCSAGTSAMTPLRPRIASPTAAGTGSPAI